MSKQYFIVIFICAVLHKNVVLSTDAKTYAPNGIVNNTMEAVIAGADNNSTNNATSSIIAEGGHIKLNPIPAAVHHGRENVVNESPTVTQKPDHSKVTVNTNATTNSTKLHSTVPGLVSSTTVLPTLLTTASNTKSTTLLSETSLPVEVHGDSKIKPRKGVDINLPPPESNSTISNSTLHTSTSPVVTNATVLVTNATTVTTNTTTVTTNRTITSSTTPSTTTVKPKKPTVTIGSDDEPPLARAPPKIIMDNRVLQPKNLTGPLPILIANGGEQVISNRQLKKEPDYVLPIVLTILAVPLLAIILTVVYKRGAEWWQHRHYRRMDFLIDGMYNN